MSKRTDRRKAERAAHKLALLSRTDFLPVTTPLAGIAYQQSRQATETPAEAASFETASSHFTVAEPPPAPVSEAQLAANRANAQHSTGATTPEGKAKSSMNALKHGLTGKTVLLPTDDDAEYERQLQSQIRVLKPATEEELAIVQSVVDSAWRIARIKALETGIMLKGQLEFASRYEDQTPARRAQLIDVETYLKYEKSIRNLNIQEARLHRQIEKAQAELLRLQANRRREEMLAATSKPAAPRQPSPSSEPNGFEFSTANTTSSLAAVADSNHFD